MGNKTGILRFLGVALVVTALAGTGHANVWMDESFDDGSPFTQGTGVIGAVPGANLDTYSWTQPLANPVSNVLTSTGTVVTTKSFRGTSSYRLQTGQPLAAGQPYQDQTNGDFQIFQFAVNADPIPAAGTVSEFRWVLDMDNATNPGAENSFFVRLVSTGSAVNIIGGEDVANVTPVTGSLGTLADSSSWAFITLVSQKNPTATADSRPALAGLGTISQGVHFFNSSSIEKLVIPFTGGSAAAFQARNWGFTVSSGTVYLDNLYWDGGMDNIAFGVPPDAQNTQPLGLTKSSAASDWTLFE